MTFEFAQTRRQTETMGKFVKEKGGKETDQDLRLKADDSPGASSDSAAQHRRQPDYN